MRKKNEILVIAVVFAAWCMNGTAAQVDWGAMSARLDTALTEQQVMNAIGYGPNKIEMETCGGAPGIATWTCKKHTYGQRGNNITVFFIHSSDGTWRVSPFAAVSRPGRTPSGRPRSGGDLLGLPAEKLAAEC
jgi:hypothetical protein